MAAKLAIMTHSRALKNNFYTRYSSYKRSALCFHVVQFGTSPAQFPIKSKKKKEEERERLFFFFLQLGELQIKRSGRK